MTEPVPQIPVFALSARLDKWLALITEPRAAVAVVVMTRMATAMVNFLAALVGHAEGGLAYVLLGAMLLVAGISGAKTADMAAVAPVLFPDMKKRGIHEGELVSLLAASGAMAETIPPSIVLIIIGSVQAYLSRLCSPAVSFPAGCSRWR
jgi:TRAP-type C4-dicarboxylate transport system permease large subunit